MGVKPITVGGGQQPSDFFKSRDWRIPFLGYFYFEPPASARGRRTLTITGTDYKPWGGALYLSSPSASANKVYELAEGQLIPVQPNGGSAEKFFDGYFYMSMTMNKASGNPANAAGECLQGFGIGSMEKDTPWIGFATTTNVVIHVQWNFTRSKWELFAASNSDPGVRVDLALQPDFNTDQRLPEIAMEWIPPNTINIYCNGQLIHTQDMYKMLPTGIIEVSDINQPDVIMFLTNGSNAAMQHAEAGYYHPRLYQPIKYQSIL